MICCARATSVAPAERYHPRDLAREGNQQVPNDKAGQAGGAGAAPAKPEHKTYSILIDKKLFKVEQPTLTGAELRALPDTDIGPEFDLFLVVPGGMDQLIAIDQVVELREGQHFVSVPRDVTPGSDGR
jgi:hypothetical protein